MKPAASVLGLFILITCFASINYAQQQFVQTVTAQNKNCNAVCSVIDIPALNNNPSAVIFITPTAANYPHPIGAYYMYLNKWSVFNLDGTAMLAGTTFNVEYYATPDSSHFVYVAPPFAHTNDVRYLDHAGLNNKPNAQVQVFPTNSPPNGVNGANFNRTEVKADYDLTTSKWFIYNVINPPVPVPAGTAYNIKFSGADPTFTNPNAGKELNNPNVKTPVSSSGCNCVIPTTLPPNGSAGGDLSGSYPNPTVTGLQGRPVSNNQPKLGQILKWGIAGWEPADENTAPANTTTPPNTTTATAAPAIQTFFKNVDEESIMLDGVYNGGFKFVTHKYTLTVTQNSRLIINANFRFRSDNCTACGSSQMAIALFSNNVYQATPTENLMGNSSYARGLINNYMMDVGPGTYTIEFEAQHPNIDGNVKGWVTAKYSSIMIMPR